LLPPSSDATLLRLLAACARDVDVLVPTAVRPASADAEMGLLLTPLPPLSSVPLLLPLAVGATGVGVRAPTAVGSASVGLMMGCRGCCCRLRRMPHCCCCSPHARGTSTCLCSPPLGRRAVT
jgi:hypothetical protein